MANDHPLLAGIRAALKASAAHSHHWGELRREVFPGETAWLSLKAWCAENNFDCELAFSQSSKGTHVQFRRLTKAAIAAATP